MLNIPPSLLEGLRLPVVAAPMLILSTPQLVIETCRSGVIGTFPAHNPRTTETYAEWLDQIEAGRDDQSAIYGVNLIVARINHRLADDLAVTVRRKVPLVITSFGADRDVVKTVHDYGGVVFHDVASARHVEIAAEAGVDGIILLTGGAGGHTGFLNPFAFIQDARRRFDGTIILAGALSTGGDIAAATVAGADLAYMGTRFIASDEAGGADEYKAMLTRATASDVVATAAMTGTPASFLCESLRAAGIDPGTLDLRHPMLKESPSGVPLKPWKDIWSAGQGVAGIDDVLPTAGLIARLTREYHEALSQAVAASTLFKD